MLENKLKKEICEKKIQQREVQLYNIELQLIESKAAGDTKEVQKNVTDNIKKVNAIIKALNKELESVRG